MRHNLSRDPKGSGFQTIGCDLLYYKSQADLFHAEAVVAEGQVFPQNQSRQHPSV